MGEYTLGPWKVRKGNLCWVIDGNLGERKYELAQVAQLGDAHLIAAAPDLLEACKHIRAHLEPITRFYEDEWARRLDAAIEKAQGGGVS